MSRAKNWVFTLNNYTDEEVKELQESNEYTYIMFGREVGASGTPHLQGHISFAQRKRLNQVKTLVPALRRAHLQVRRGTFEQAEEYNGKEDDDPFRRGDPPAGQGKRTDLDSAIETLKSGATIRDLYQEHTSVMVKFGRGMKEAYVQLQPKRQKKVFPLESFSFHPIVFEDGYSHILLGESGCGKTSYLRSLFPESLFVSHMDDLTQFDQAYHTAIVFDDMSFLHMPRTAQIHVVDQDDDRSIHVRYTTAFIPAGTKKFFTTNVRQIFDLDDAAIKRRVKVHSIISRLDGAEGGDVVGAQGVLANFAV